MKKVMFLLFINSACFALNIVNSTNSSQAIPKIGTELILEVQKEIILMDQTKKIEWVAQIFSCPESENSDSLLNCNPRLVINNIEYNKIPKAIFIRLLSYFGLRRSISYDYFTGGIIKHEKEIICAAAIDGEGLVLKTLYNKDENSSTSKPQESLQEVYSVSLNCAYPYIITPNNPQAREDARATIEIINTLKEILTGQPE